jgi:TolB protein
MPEASLGRHALAHLAPLVAAALTGCHDAPCSMATAGAPWLAFASNRTGNYDLFVTREDGTCLRQITSDSGQDLLPSWSSTGKLAFTSDRGGARRVWVHDLDSGSEVPLELGGLSATSPAWSPDGAALAFEGWVPGLASSDVYLADARGGQPFNLTGDASYNSGPAWSPDGQTLYFVSNRTGRYEVHVLRPADCTSSAGGCPASAVTTGSRIVGKPSVSPDGALLVFARTVAGSSDSEVVALTLATGGIRVVSGPGDSEPAITAAGTRVVLRSYRYGNPELVLVDLATGAELRRLTDDPASDGSPSWAPVR